MNPHFVLRTCAAISLCVLTAADPLSQESSATAQGPKNVAILIFPGVELLDFAGPGETFAAVRSANGPAFRVYTVAETLEPVVSMGFVSITPEYTFEEHPKADIVVAPGGKIPMGSDAVRSWLSAQSETAELMMSVCNGAGLLGRAGLLAGLEVTTHHGSLQSLAALVPSATVYSNRRFVDNGHVLTTAGVSAGIDGSLHVVSRMLGEAVAQETADYMEYDWRPSEIRELHARPGVEVGARGDWILETLAEHGLEATLVSYRAKEAAGGEEFVQANGQVALNREGYSLVSGRRIEQAIVLFEFIVAAFPTSANAQDSLSEAYEIAGDHVRALAAAVQALKLMKSDTELSAAHRERLETAANERIVRIGADKQLVFACKPCNRECDEARFEEPGRCPDAGCGMVLLPVGVGE